jgi:hypothetical protein
MKHFSESVNPFFTTELSEVRPDCGEANYSKAMSRSARVFCCRATTVPHACADARSSANIETAPAYVNPWPEIVRRDRQAGPGQEKLVRNEEPTILVHWWEAWRTNSIRLSATA